MKNMASISKADLKYQAEEDVRTMRRAMEILRDPHRKKHAMLMAEKDMKALVSLRTGFAKLRP